LPPGADRRGQRRSGADAAHVPRHQRPSPRDRRDRPGGDRERAPLPAGRRDGFEVARQLRQEYGQSIRIIAVSAYASENDRRQSLEAGCELLLVKPADPRFIERLLG